MPCRTGESTCRRAALGAALGLLFAVPATAAAQAPLRAAGAERAVGAVDLAAGHRARVTAVPRRAPPLRRPRPPRRDRLPREQGPHARRPARLRLEPGARPRRHRATRATWRAAATSPTSARAARRVARRARAAGCRGRRVGEAIAYGCGSVEHPARDRPHVAGERAAPRDPALAAGAAVGIGVAGRPPVRCGGRGATYVLDAG